MKTKTTARLLKITEPDRLAVAKEIIIEHRRHHKGHRASYELYGITYGKNKLLIKLLDDAPTSGDFAPVVTKARLLKETETWCMVVEFRGAWKSDDEAKVVAYETEARAQENL